ncbi:MAG: hypothetical protein D3910_20490, partial [Candidatus Electrothrix sp. ATG2]|nr:hypothetical protein [Candidatus Electrothrix sp. ATG2]
MFSLRALLRPHKNKKLSRYFLFFIVYSLSCNFTGCASEPVLSSLITKKVTKKKQIIPANYIISPWDELAILYYVDPDYSVSEYTIETEDKLLVDFFYYPDLTKTVRVRPDGFITLSKLGEIKAAGEKPRLLAKKIS